MELDGSSCTFLSCFSLNLGGGGGGGGLMVPDVVDDTIDILTVGDCIPPAVKTTVNQNERGGVLPIAKTREKVKAGQSVSSPHAGAFPFAPRTKVKSGMQRCASVAKGLRLRPTKKGVVSPWSSSSSSSPPPPRAGERLRACRSALAVILRRVCCVCALERPPGLVLEIGE